MFNLYFIVLMICYVFGGREDVVLIATGLFAIAAAIESHK